MAWDQYINAEEKKIDQKIFGSPHDDIFVEFVGDFDTRPIAKDTIYSYYDAYMRMSNDELYEHRLTYDPDNEEEEIYPICWISCQETGFGQMSTLATIAAITSDQKYVFGKHSIFLNNETMGEITYPITDQAVEGMPFNNLNNLSGYEYISTPFSSQYNVAAKTVKVETNIPLIIFREQNITQSEQYIICKNYVDNGDFSGIEEAIEAGNAIYFNPETMIEPTGAEFTIYNTGQRGTWTKGDIVSNVSTPFYRWVKIKLSTTPQMDGRFAFYRAGLEDNIIKLKPVRVAAVISCEYSTDGGATWNDSNTFPFSYIYGERINELGTFIYATRSGLSGETGVPVFETEEEAIGWVNHDPNVSIDQALNYSDIAGGRYEITNPTGIKETASTMGTNAGIASLFSQKYLCNKSDIEKIARALYDTGAGHIWEDIKEGLEMMGENPINAVCGLQYFPIDLSQVFSRTSLQSYVYFGGYYFKPSDHGEQDLNILKILGFDGYIDLGEFTIERSFRPPENVFNFEPYCNLQIYLPYVGLEKLSYNKYVGKTIKARYYIDINSGGCLACLFCDNVLTDFFNGNMGVNLPITLTDFAGYAEAQINNLASFAGVGGNAAGAISAGASGNITGAAGASVASVAGFEKSIYEVSTTNLDQYNTTKGGSSALGNGYLPQYIYLVFEFIQTDETPNLIQLAGRASNASGVLNSFSGYLEIDDIELKTSAGMTESEKAEFISLLHSGVII